MKPLAFIGGAILAAGAVVIDIAAMQGVLYLINEGGDFQVAAAFIGTVLLICLNVIGGSAAWSRLRRYIAPMIVLVAAVTLSGCYKTIEPGRAGVKVQQTGTNKGVAQIPVETGRVFYNPFNEYVLEYPTNVQRAIWTKTTNEGKADNEEIAFQSSDQLHFTVDVAVAYQLVHEKVPAFYVQFRNDDIDAFTHGFFRDAVRKSIGLAAQQFSQEEINGGKQADLEHRAQEALAAFMEPYGVRIIQLAFTSPPRAPDAVRTAIEQKIAATQRAEQIENEKRQSIAEGAKTVALAQAQATANGLITASISPTLIQWEQMKVLREKWDGHMPMVQSGGGSGLMIQVPTGGMK